MCTFEDRVVFKFNVDRSHSICPHYILIMNNQILEENSITNQNQRKIPGCLDHPVRSLDI